MIWNNNDIPGIAMSYEDLLKLREKNQGDGNTYEYIDGYMFGSPSDYHAKLLSTVGAMLENYINKNNLNCVVLSGAAIQSKINNKIKDVIPDIMVKCKDEYFNLTCGYNSRRFFNIQKQQKKNTLKFVKISLRKH